MLVMAWSSKAPEGTMTAYLARVKMQEGTMTKRSRAKGCNDQEIKSHEGRTGERKHMNNRHHMHNIYGTSHPPLSSLLTLAYVAEEASSYSGKNNTSPSSKTSTNSVSVTLMLRSCLLPPPPALHTLSGLWHFSTMVLLVLDPPLSPFVRRIPSLKRREKSVYSSTPFFPASGSRSTTVGACVSGAVLHATCLTEDKGQIPNTQSTVC